MLAMIPMWSVTTQGLWKDDFAFLNRPDQGDIQADLATLASAESKLSVICGKYDLSFEPSEPEACRAEVPGATIHILDAGISRLTRRKSQCSLRQF